MTTAAVCVTGIVAVVGVDTTRGYQRPDWRAAGRVLGAQPAPGVAVRAVLVQDYRDRLPLSLYLPGLNFLNAPLGAGQRAGRRLDQSSARAALLVGGGVQLSGSGSSVTTRSRGSTCLAAERVPVHGHASESSRPVVLTPAIVAAALRTTIFRRDELLVQRRP